MPIRAKSSIARPSAAPHCPVFATSRGSARDWMGWFGSASELTVRENSLSPSPVRRSTGPRRRPGVDFNARKSGGPGPWRRTSGLSNGISRTSPEDEESRVTGRRIQSGRVTNGARGGVNVLASGALHAGRPEFPGRVARPMLERNQHPPECASSQCRGPLVTHRTGTRLEHSVWRASP